MINRGNSMNKLVDFGIKNAWCGTFAETVATDVQSGLKEPEEML